MHAMPTVNANGVDLYYEERGHGEPLLLMSPTGWPGSVWQLEQVGPLSERYRVIVYDQRGVGGSSKPDVEYSTRMLGEDALGLLGAVDALPAHVLGFSVGGRAAQLMAIEHPECFRALILAGSDAGRPALRQTVPADLALAMFDPGYDHPAFWLDHLSRELAFTPRFREERRDKVQALAETIWRGRPPAKLYLRHVIARTSHWSGERLSDIRVPTLVLAGEDDRAGGTADHVGSARLLANAIPGAQLRLVEGARHLFPWETPEATNEAILGFLGGLSGRA